MSGLSALKMKQNMAKKAAKLGQIMEQNALSEMLVQFQEFKSKLEQFASKHKKEINEDPVFRKHFQTMCKEVGVDPLSSSKGSWSGAIGLNNFYYELGIQVVNICIALRNKYGSVIEVGECLKYLERIRGKNATKVSDEDIKKSIEQLKILGSPFNIFNIDKKQYISSLPMELNSDNIFLMKLAEEKGYVCDSMIKAKLGWDSVRFNEAIKSLLNEGIAWIDEHPYANGSNFENALKEEVFYWFPSVMNLGSNLSEYKAS